jgi:hypothetical protein
MEGTSIRLAGLYDRLYKADEGDGPQKAECHPWVEEFGKEVV